MTGRRLALLCVAAMLWIPVSTAADVSLSGQVRPRFEFLTLPGDRHDTFTSMRVRLGIQAKLEKSVGVLVQLQDVRLWGEEANTLTDYQADQIDLRQGYFELGRPGEPKLSVRAGRQMVDFGGQRLVGSVEWTQQGRAFDGIRMSVESGGGRVDVVAMKLKEESAPTHATNGYLLGAYGTFHPRPSLAADLYALYDRESGAAETDRATFGTRLLGTQSRLEYRFEGSYQAGRQGGKDVAAWMAGARAGAAVCEGRARVTLWYDHLSGDDDPSDAKTRVFDTLFATNHKYYGFADLFLNLPAHTGGLGLRDAALKVGYSPSRQVSLALDVHRFDLAKQGAFASPHLGEELDITVSYKYSSEVAFTCGVSFVFAKDALIQLGRIDGDVVFGYLMTNVTF